MLPGLSLGGDGKQQHLWLLPYKSGEETVYDRIVAAAANAEWRDQYNQHPNLWEAPLIRYPFIYVPAQSSTGTFDQWPGSVGTLILIGLDQARGTGPGQ